MSDRELLELAAKAAGINIEPEWNPLTDDGDALRLAVKLKLHIERWDDCIDVMPNYSAEYCSEEIFSDPYEPTRRAIVRTAAKIGKDMI